MFYLGLDPSLTNFGVVLFDGNENKIVKSIILKTTPAKIMEERLLKLTNNVFEIITKIKNPQQSLRIAIEGLSFGSRGQSMAELGALHYFLRILMLDNNLKYQVVPPTVLKKFICGTGRAKKEQMLLHAYKRFNVSFESSDICDAYCLARLIQEHPNIQAYIDESKKTPIKTKPKTKPKTPIKPKTKLKSPKPKDLKDGDKK